MTIAEARPHDPDGGDGAEGTIEPRFVARVEPRADELVVRLCGELDADAAPALRAEIDDWPIVPATTVDLSGLTFIDSTGIGCLLKLQQRVVDAGGLPVARGVVPSLRRTLEVTGLNRTFAIID